MIRFDIWQEIYSSLRRNKLRTFLTGFSVAWGIFILIVLLGAGNGLIHAFEEQSKDISVNTIQIYPGQTSKSYKGLKEGRNIYLDETDRHLSKQDFQKNITKVSATMTIGGSPTLTYGDNYVGAGVRGVYPNYRDIEPMTIGFGKGRFINELDIRDCRKVIVINERSRKVIFPKNDALGKDIKVGDVMYHVVGVYKDRGNEQNSTAYIPFTTAKAIYAKGDTIDNLILTTKGLNTEKANNDFEKSYRKVIAEHHKFDPDDKSGIWIWNRFTDYLQTLQTKNVLNTAIWVIGIFTLMSGIVGVSNIMLITVRERTKEFGIRKALGASPSSILWLVITESVFITTIFGYVGMVLGVAATEYMNFVAGNQTFSMGGDWHVTIFSNPTVDIHVAINATLTLIIAGTLAGLFPARKAVRIKPIEALQSE